MNEQEALQHFFPPWKPRPGKPWGGGVLQIHVTRACTRACYNCTQGSNLGGKTYFMPPDLFEKAVISLEGYPYLIAIFGGQPTLSPHFPKYCEIMRRLLPIHKRGLWTNALHGHGAECRKTFRPENCNLNVHLDQKDYDEFRSTWPEARPFGLDNDSRHSPVFVAMKDLGISEEDRWKLISSCDIAAHWSSLIGMFRGQLRGWICEIQGAMSMLHQENPDYPDTGLDPTKEYEIEGRKVKWWQLPIESFAHQIRYHCHSCGIPLRGHGENAMSSSPEAREQVSVTHQSVYKPKKKDRRVELVMVEEQLGNRLESMVKYLQNADK